MSSTIYLPPLQKKSTVKHCSKIAQQAPLVTVGKARCFNSFQTVKKTVRDGALKRAFVKDAIVNPSRNKGGAGLGGHKKNSFFVHHVILSQLGHSITTNLVA